MDALRRFVPARLDWRSNDLDQAVVEWVHVEEERFEDAFFDQTLQRAVRRPFNHLFRPRMTFDELVAWSHAHPGMAPSGFILHVSRCGSTQLAHLLGRAEGTLVLSEPEALDAVLRPREGIELTPDRRVALVRAIVTALGQPRSADQRRLIVKLDAWHGLEIATLRAAFPTTPLVFLYRDPLEVLVSLMHERGVQTVPQIVPPAVFGLEPEAADAPAEVYISRVLAALYRPGLAIAADPLGLLVDHAALPEAAWKSVAAHFDFKLTPAELTRMQAGGGQNLKRGGEFTPDAAAKQAGATEDQRAAVDQWVRPIYRALEAASASRRR